MGTKTVFRTLVGSNTLFKLKIMKVKDQIRM